MNDARDAILTAVRRSLGRIPDGTAPAVAAPPAVPLLGAFDLDLQGRLDSFRERLQAVGGHPQLVTTHEQAAGVIAAILRAADARTVAWSDGAALTPVRKACSLPEALRELPDDASTAALLSCDVGITAAQWGIAETGSIVLESDAERHRLRSLLAPVHIALLPASRILTSLGEVLKTLRRPLSPAVTVITGPSRTADIELNLVVGVHGPRELHVLVIPG